MHPCVRPSNHANKSGNGTTCTRACLRPKLLLTEHTDDIEAAIAVPTHETASIACVAPETDSLTMAAKHAELARDEPVAPLQAQAHSPSSPPPRHPLIQPSRLKCLQRNFAHAHLSRFHVRRWRS